MERLAVDVCCGRDFFLQQPSDEQDWLEGIKASQSWFWRCLLGLVILGFWEVGRDFAVFAARRCHWREHSNQCSSCGFGDFCLWMFCRAESF